MGASAGGVEAFSEIVSGLPADLPASVFVVLHTSPETPGILPRILSRAGALGASHAVDGEKIESGRIYVAPPDYHLVLKRGHVKVLRGPKENRHRPAIDPLFRSAAYVYGPRVIAVLLTGVLDDGAAGLRAVKQRGGVVVVQDPKTAAYPQMPRNGLAHVEADHIVAVDRIAPLLVELVGKAAPAAPPTPIDLEKEAKIVEFDMRTIDDPEKPGTPSVFACPECDGVLWEIEDGDLVRYRCRVGHSYSSESLVTAKAEALEGALWAALRALEESSALARRSAKRVSKRKLNAVAKRFAERAENTEEHARLIRQILLTDPALHKDEELTGTG